MVDFCPRPFVPTSRERVFIVAMRVFISGLHFDNGCNSGKVNFAILRLLRRVKTALNHVSEMLINHVGLLISNQSLIND